MKDLLFVICTLAFLSACNNGTATEGAEKDTVSTETAAPPEVAPSPDTVAKEMYAGILPCVDCDSIRMVLYLKADSTFEKSTTYNGVQDSTISVAPEKGRWTMIADTLSLLQTNAPNKFIRRDSVLLQLDMLGQPMMNRQGDTIGLKKLMMP